MSLLKRPPDPEGFSYTLFMSTAELRKSIRRAVAVLPAESLQSLADYAAFLSRRKLISQIQKAEKQIKAGRGVNWRTVRRDV